MRAVMVIWIAMLPWCSSVVAAAPSIMAVVVAVSDGDTITIQTLDHQRLKVRLAEIDAPESSQPYGARSKRELSEILFRRLVVVRPSGTDRYGRTIAHIETAGRDAGRLMIERGAAWYFVQFGHDPRLAAAERTARKDRIGLWALSAEQRVPPWAWRQTDRSRPRRPVTALPLVPWPGLNRPMDAAADRCASKRFCAQMSSCEDAVYHLRVCGQKRLDGDRDGKPCERLCG